MDVKQNLLVEGNDDMHVVYALCEQFHLKETFNVIDSKGIENLLKGLPIRLKSSGEVKTIGVIIDADINTGNRWQSIRSILISSGKYNNVPDICPDNGLIIHPILSDDIKFGLWIMPDNHSTGMLENFTTFLIPEKDQLLTIVDRTLTEIEREGLSRYPSAHHEKARIHTWLAWQETPGTPMGLAITKKYLSTEPQICNEFVAWLRRLFN